MEYINLQTAANFNLTIYNDLKTLPHFDADLSLQNTPDSILEFRELVKRADGVIICTPEYVFSIPSGLKNIIEWCVSTTVFSNKPLGIITASAQGSMGHEELQMILQTIEARFNNKTCLLIQGIKGKISPVGEITDEITKIELTEFIEAFKSLVGI